MPSRWTPGSATTVCFLPIQIEPDATQGLEIKEGIKLLFIGVASMDSGHIQTVSRNRGNNFQRSKEAEVLQNPLPLISSEGRTQEYNE